MIIKTVFSDDNYPEGSLESVLAFIPTLAEAICSEDYLSLQVLHTMKEAYVTLTFVTPDEIREVIATIESNNGGRGFARVVQRLCPTVKVEWFHQSNNKEARILSNSATVIHSMRMPHDWNIRWSELYTHLTTYRRLYSANRWHDAADVLTGIVEQQSGSHVRKVRFFGK